MDAGNRASKSLLGRKLNVPAKSICWTEQMYAAMQDQASGVCTVEQAARRFTYSSSMKVGA
jgi:hypothetical protein